MKYGDFATIMAMYPTTPTKKISEMFGFSPQIIKVMANSCGVHKEGRKRQKVGRTSSCLVIYNALTAEVHFEFQKSFRLIRSRKPVKLRLKWDEL
jgi:hypothetical protein